MADDKSTHLRNAGLTTINDSREGEHSLLSLSFSRRPYLILFKIFLHLLPASLTGREQASEPASETNGVVKSD
jgi:hypothetical protein